MKKLIVAFVAFWLVSTNFIIADEGMWLPLLIRSQIYDKMKDKGLELTPEQIYDINNSSIKDAIVGFGQSDYPIGFFCTGEIISNEGLLLTNHHCGYESIQQHSSVSHDYLTDGFWAMSKSEELANEGLAISILVRMEDVTEKVIAELNDTMSEDYRNQVIDEISRKIETEAAQGNEYITSVKSMLHNNKFYLLIYETFLDVRLVGAPPSSIGKFGGDTDNWMWPRHTGDFSIFRIYTGPDGKPAKYSKDNIPYKPKHYLPVSIKGVKEDDFAMILGFPGSTDRYLTSYGVDETININNPSAIKIRTEKLDIMKKDMDSSDKIRIEYASKYAQTSNYWKYFIGQNKGLARLKVYDKKQALENNLDKWINADPARKQKYGEALDLIEQAYNESKVTSKVNQYINEALFQGPEIILFPYQTLMLYNTLVQMPDNAEAIKEQAEISRESAKTYFKDYNPETDKKLFVALMKMYYNDIPKEYHLDFFNIIEKKYKGNFEKYADMLFSKSIFTDSTRFYAYLDKPSSKGYEKDPAFEITKSVLKLYFQLSAVTAPATSKLERGIRLLVAAQMEMEKDKAFYPDANSTLRLTYGTVGSYKPMDAVHYKYYTTIDGIMEKEDPKNEEFVVPEKLKQLYNAKDYGKYGQNGTLNVCFTTNNDITGGNSGSPVINGKGELIGTAFDGNWEAMSGDIAFENELQKTIICDIRYVLFIIDKYAGAKNLINELTIVE